MGGWNGKHKAGCIVHTVIYRIVSVDGNIGKVPRFYFYALCLEDFIGYQNGFIAVFKTGTEVQYFGSGTGGPIDILIPSVSVLQLQVFVRLYRIEVACGNGALQRIQIVGYCRWNSEAQCYVLVTGSVYFG